MNRHKLKRKANAEELRYLRERIRTESNPVMKELLRKRHEETRLRQKGLLMEDSLDGFVGG